MCRAIRWWPTPGRLGASPTTVEPVKGHYPAGIAGFRSDLSGLTSSPSCQWWSRGETWQEAIAMRLPLVRFTVQRMMVAVAVVALIAGTGIEMKHRHKRFGRLAHFHWIRAVSDANERKQNFH